MPATLIPRIAFSIAVMRLSGVRSSATALSATALYSASLHRAAASRRLVGFAVTIADARSRSRAPGLKVIARPRAGVGLRPCGVVVALL